MFTLGGNVKHTSAVTVSQTGHGSSGLIALMVSTQWDYHCTTGSLSSCATPHSFGGGGANNESTYCEHIHEFGSCQIFKFYDWFSPPWLKSKFSPHSSCFMHMSQLKDKCVNNKMNDEHLPCTCSFLLILVHCHIDLKGTLSYNRAIVNGV